MLNDNDSVQVIRTKQELRIDGRKDSKQRQPHPRDQRKHEEESGHATDEHAQRQILPEHRDSVEWGAYNLELGRLILERQNLENSLVSRISKKAGTDEEHQEQRRQMIRIENRIEEIEQTMAELTPESIKRENSVTGENLRLMLVYLHKIGELYRQYLESTHGETLAIEKESLEELQELMDEKAGLLNRIGKLQQLVDFQALRNLPENSIERVKAGRLLSDIHNRVNQIIDQESLNSVELQQQKEELSVALGRQQTGSRILSKYAGYLQRSRFIDTTK